MKLSARICTLALGIAAATGSAHAVNLSPNGMGQALIYPYYTVEAGQQTLLTVVNTSSVGKALKVRFLESYNGRLVLSFTLFLSPHDVWSAVVFKLSDAGLPGAGAAIFTTDKSCMAPYLAEGPLANGATYQHFLPYAYTGSQTDTGPTTDARTNEGHFEIIAMSDVVAGSPLAADIMHVNGVPPGCSRAEADFETGTGTVTPTSGLFGAASIVDVAEGTFYAFNAEALDGFTAVRLNSPTGADTNLSSANDPGGTTATAQQFIEGRLVTSVYPKTRAIDAVSAVFAADAVYNEYIASGDGSVATDWVLTLPTKQFYVDKELVSAAQAPFEHLFGAHDALNGPGLSCVGSLPVLFDRDENTTLTACHIDPCPPGPPPAQICYETNVLQFGAHSVLGSQLTAQVVPAYPQGVMQLLLDGTGFTHAIPASSNGNVFHGLPVIGFAVTKYVNGSVPLSGGGSALANYTGAYRHHPTTNCTAANGPCS